MTDYGFRYAGVRALDKGEIHVRTYQFILPFHQIRPGKETGVGTNAGHAWVPIDDENTMVYNWTYCPSRPLSEDTKLERALGNGPLHVDVVTFRSKANRANNYLLDRELQRRDNFTGIDGINVQDRAIQQSMGRIVDRSKEHLGPADKARKLLLKAVKAVEAGNVPDGVGVRYDTLAAYEAVLPRDGELRGFAVSTGAGAQMAGSRAGQARP